MKKYIALILCILLMAISIVSCTNKNDGNDTESEAPSQSIEQSESETEEESEEEYTAPIFEDTEPPEVTVDEKQLGEAGEDGEGDWSGYYPKN